MTHEPTLVIMAAGMGSRFGGLKQMTPVDEEGHFIIDFSLYDAYQAGFRRVAFIIKREIEQTFRETIGARMEKWFHVDYVYQELDRLPEGFAVPEGRKKPWGTAHAVACCRGVVEGPFAVINSDDFYGRGAYEEIYRFLTEHETPHHYAMLGYQLRNTVTEFGSVARGVCHVQDGMLLDITERTKIFKRGQDAAYTEDGETFVPLSGDTSGFHELLGLYAGDSGRDLERVPGVFGGKSSGEPGKVRVLSADVCGKPAGGEKGQRARAAVHGDVARCDIQRRPRQREIGHWGTQAGRKIPREALGIISARKTPAQSKHTPRGRFLVGCMVVVCVRQFV